MRIYDSGRLGDILDATEGGRDRAAAHAVSLAASAATATSSASVTASVATAASVAAAAAATAAARAARAAAVAKLASLAATRRRCKVRHQRRVQRAKRLCADSSDLELGQCRQALARQSGERAARLWHSVRGSSLRLCRPRGHRLRAKAFDQCRVQLRDERRLADARATGDPYCSLSSAAAPAAAATARAPPPPPLLLARLAIRAVSVRRVVSHRPTPPSILEQPLELTAAAEVRLQLGLVECLGAAEARSAKVNASADRPSSSSLSASRQRRSREASSGVLTPGVRNLRPPRARRRLPPLVVPARGRARRRAPAGGGGK